ncbi:hypothetical protein LCGC14_0402140 [marine sediment metagenome]|uniref:Uncharacterized protein n=1 Tax=marine sediment metagenome TaxID=412755 RepID=A0A0F9W5N5_9ZZZZ|nr:hypothetical protein [Phycisphaerae bacterium]HDZ42754.1 hypothetical protein [Phycisphaerae bacterium]
MTAVDNTQTSSSSRRTIELVVLVGLVTAFGIISALVRFPLEEGEKLRDVIGIIIGAGLTFIFYSFLYRDNPLFKIAENLYVGVALGYGAIITWRQSLRPEVYDPLFRAVTSEAFWHELSYRVVPIVLGILLMTRLSKKHSWLSRYSYGLMVGWGAGMGIFVVTDSYILKQLEGAIRPLQKIVTDPDVAANLSFFDQAWPVVGSLVILIGTVSVLFYFFFSVPHKRLGSGFSRVGISYLMIAFGASFGYTVMGRMSLLIGRVQFLMFEWLKIKQ